MDSIVSRAGVRALTATAVLTTVFTLAGDVTAQERGERSDMPGAQSNANASQRYAEFTDLRGAPVCAHTGMGTGGQLGGEEKAETEGEQPSLGQPSGGDAKGDAFGMLVDICVPTPDAKGSAALGRVSGTGSGEAQAIVVLTGLTDTPTPTDATHPRSGGAGDQKRVAIPLRELTWNPEQRQFTCAKSAQELQSMPAWESPSTGGATGGLGGEPTGERETGRSGLGEGTGQGGGEQRPYGASGTADAGKKLEATKISTAQLNTQDNQKLQLSGLVFDVQGGSLAYLLTRAESGLGLGGRTERGADVTDHPPGGQGQDRPSQGRPMTAGEAHAIPWQFVSVEGGGTDRMGTDKPGGTEDRDPTGAGRGMGTGGMLALKVPFTAEQIQQAPKLNPDELSELESGRDEEIRQFFSRMSPGAESGGRR